MPKNIYHCTNCHIEFESRIKNRKFCSKSCAASYNNTGRIRTEESKKKTSQSLLGKPHSIARRQKQMLKRKFTNCPICNTDMVYIIGAWRNKKTCGAQECINEYLRRQQLANPSKTCGKRHSKKFICENIKGESFCMCSSYERDFVEKLNSFGVYWIRPQQIPYIDSEGYSRHYFPDVYVPEWDTYYDPKNDYLIKLGNDKKKIDFVMKQNDITIVILSKQDIENFEK